MTAVTTEGRGATGAPVRGLTVLYDAQCALCTHLRHWLARQSQLVPLELLPAGSAGAHARFPGLDHARTLEEITVVGDSGQVYRGSRAWIVVLWALREHRPLAHRLATPAGAKLARGAVLAAAKWREAQRPAGQAHPQGVRWGGQAYRRADGWSYHPGTGWTYEPPSCSGGAPATR
ncbi:DCC1-like thiol-disulfide oxidoreductase family protein [Streptomyces sp. Caat 7-52]|uniref:thiol-disulfide oxidoreductase DCC family protein n=1 Tax=Streptomyces sp. Caat 7-52 TaxID=2949637 RepID=UPI0020356C79|nr:DCC1-like thiol-disulfide oxidoreductase family protein [Streptomyces sp. Caat 7-52]